MTRPDLKHLPGFIEWAERGEASSYFKALSECIDNEIGNRGYPNLQPHEANINLGIQQAVRLTRQLISDPLCRSVRKVELPRPSYGTDDTNP